MRILKIAGTASLLAASSIALAQAWPSKPIRWIVGFPPGGGADVLSRMLSPKISEALGQQIIIDNRGGAGGNIGAEIAAKSPPDGYTILFAYSGTHSVNRSIYSHMPFQDSDFAPIIWTAAVPQILVVHPSLPVKNVKELIALAKSKPDQLIYGSTGSGAINHLAGELFKLMTNTKMVHVPYKGGGPVSIALLSGEVSILFAEPATIVQHIKSGKVRALAVTTPKHALAMPELPTVAESGVPGYDVTSWNGMLIPAATPPDIVKRYNVEFNKAISAPDMRQRMIDNGYEPVGGEPAKLSELIRAETAKWAKVVKAAGMKVD
ncbi:MAG: tripartite tricarboxylate transporter substrate binding protein [Burkholderiales bacterium]